jgi:HSP20 family protein
MSLQRYGGIPFNRGLLDRGEYSPWQLSSNMLSPWSGDSMLGRFDATHPSLSAMNQVNAVANPLLCYDFIEEHDKYSLRAPLPGVTKDDLNVFATDRGVTVQIVKSDCDESDESGVHSWYSSSGSFSRTFEVPPNGDFNSSSVLFKDGSLCVEVPKYKDGNQCMKLKISSTKSD